MPNITEKTSSNAYYRARLEAAKHNEQLSSRENAGEIMAIERGRMYRIEHGNTDPYPEEVHMMADLYNAPELENYYCTNACPLGCQMHKVEALDLDRISVMALSTFRKVSETRETLLDITEDGVIDESEKDALARIVENLDEMERVTQSLKLWIRKNMQ